MKTINCDHLVDYFNHELSEQEEKQFEAHLNTCSECQEELKELIELTGELPYLSEPLTPPNGMKSRIMGEVFKEPEVGVVSESRKRMKKSWWTPLIAAVLLISLLGNAYMFLKMNGVTNNPNNVATILHSVKLEPSEKWSGTAIAEIYEQDGEVSIAVKADQLKQATGEEVYQIWLLKNGKPIPAGTFIPDTEGSGASYFSLTSDEWKDWDTMAITLEPRLGNELPEGETVLSSSL